MGGMGKGMGMGMPGMPGGARAPSARGKTFGGKIALDNARKRKRRSNRPRVHPFSILISTLSR